MRRRLPADVGLTVDGHPVRATSGQSLYGALVAHGLWHHRRDLVTGGPRAGYCGMGVCFECLVEVDGRPGVRACGTEVGDGMVVRTAATP